MGGAKNCPETPRQKMIGMMYLVLTAMLALNVSTNVLNAFGLVDKSLRMSLENAATQNESSYTRLENMYKENPEKIIASGNLWERADSMRIVSDSLFNYIQWFKEEVHRKVDGADKIPEGDLAIEIKNKSNFDVPSHFALQEFDKVTGRPNGAELRERIVAYREQLIRIRHYDEGQARRAGQTDEAYERMLGFQKRGRDEINMIFATDSMRNTSNKLLSWEGALFEGMPVGACMAILTKYQNDIRAYEGKTLTSFFNRIGGSDYKANFINAYVIPKSSYVLQGGQYEAQIILAAVDTTDKPQYFVGDEQLGEDGIFRAPASSVGVHPFSGIVRYKKGRKIEEVAFESAYEVGQPSTSVMNLDLNVIYAEYDNRYIITCPGVTDSQLKVSFIGATGKRQGKEWVVRPTKDAKEVKVVVSADLNGTMQKMGEQTFRVKNLPKADLYLVENGQQLPSDKIVRKTLNKNTTLDMGYGADGILNVPYEVTGFSTYILGTVKKSKGNKFSTDQLKQIGSLKSKDPVIFMNVTYRVKGGEEKKYPGNFVIMMK